MSNISTVLLRDGRRLGGIIPDVVVEEVHTDTLTITDHPVEQGAEITDHAYKNPAELSMRIGWSKSSLNLNGVIGGLVSGSLLSGSIRTLRDVYEELLKLQGSRRTFDVSTGKRLYRNMLIRSLSTTTDATTENALIVTVVLRELIVVNTKVAKLKPQAQANVAKTGPVVQRGTVQPGMASTAESIIQLLRIP